MEREKIKKGLYACGNSETVGCSKCPYFKTEDCQSVMQLEALALIDEQEAIARLNIKLHNLKIKAEYANAKLDGRKPFEIRKNDREFKVGDLVRYTVIDSEECNERIKNKIYYIAYITDYAQQEDYVVFTDKEVEE